MNTICRLISFSRGLSFISFTRSQFDDDYSAREQHIRLRIRSVVIETATFTDQCRKLSLELYIRFWVFTMDEGKIFGKKSIISSMILKDEVSAEALRWCSIRSALFRSYFRKITFWIHPHSIRETLLVWSSSWCACLTIRVRSSRLFRRSPRQRDFRRSSEQRYA